MPNIISRIDYFAAGSCRNQLAFMFQGVANRNMVFPAGVFLFHHRQLGYILYDTGYSVQLTHWRLKYWLYRLANPIQISIEEQIDYQLRQQNISPEHINYVVVSHLHPDHIGRLSAFPNARFIVTKDVYATYQTHRVTDLIFKELFPEDFEQRLHIVYDYTINPLFPFTPTADLFQDGSLLLASLGGHAAGQGCLFIPDRQLFIAADTAWGIDLLPLTQQMRWLPRKIQHNIALYKTHHTLLHTIQQAGIAVVVSHDPCERVRRIIYES